MRVEETSVGEVEERRGGEDIVGFLSWFGLGRSLGEEG